MLQQSLCTSKCALWFVFSQSAIHSHRSPIKSPSSHKAQWETCMHSNTSNILPLVVANTNMKKASCTLWRQKEMCVWILLIAVLLVTTAAEGTMLLTSIHKGIINEMIWLMKQTLLLTNNSTQNKLLQSAAVRDPHQTLRAVRSLQWPFTLMEGGLVGLSNKPLSSQLWKSLDVCFLLQL